jgi:hypothetical protein
MESDFITELDKTLSNVGTDIYWKKKVGALELWISPLSVTGQEKVTGAVANAEAGSNVVAEGKRVTLANAIVGVNEKDLREFRDGAPVFPAKNKKGEPVKLRLEDWLYQKMAKWSAQYLDDAFAVYADLMESFEKQNLKDIKFENAKDPHIELQELEKRAAALRSQLGMPPLVQSGDEEPLPDENEVAEAIAREGREDKTAEEQQDFDPFRPLAPQAEPQTVAQPPQPPPQPFVPPPSAQPQPSMTMPAVLPKHLQRPVQAQESSPEQPFRPMPSVQNEVITQPAAKPTERPKIDQPQGGVNPRFAPQGGRPLR